MNQNLTLSVVISTRQQIQLVQISAERAQVVLNQLRRDCNHLESQGRLVAAIAQLKLVEANLLDDLGFTQTADQLRNGK